jgi:hypothetical protein
VESLNPYITGTGHLVVALVDKGQNDTAIHDVQGGLGFQHVGEQILHLFDFYSELCMHRSRAPMRHP